MSANEPAQDDLDPELSASLASGARPVTNRSNALDQELLTLVQSVIASRRKRRRVPVTAAVLVPLLVLGGAGAAFAASGVDWSKFWNNTPSWTGFAKHPDASITYRLPSGGSCTMRIGAITYSPAADLPAGVTADPASADLAREYLQSGNVLGDAPIKETIANDRAVGVDWYTAADGTSIHVGYGTAHYNADVEYADAVRQAIQTAITRHLKQLGVPDTGLGYQSQEQCSGMRQ